jgi:beta-glucosidase
MINMLECGKVKPTEVKTLARRVLNLIKTAVKSGISFDGIEGNVDTPETRDLLRRSAGDAVVLLKNVNGVLPLKAEKVKKVAVIGAAAALHHTSGGGAASVHVEAFVDTPLEGIQDLAKGHGIEVHYAIGNQTHLFTPLITPFLRMPGSTSGEGGVALIEFWRTQPTKDWRDPSVGEIKSDVSLDHILISKTAKCLMMDGAPRDIITGAHFVKVCALRVDKAVHLADLPRQSGNVIQFTSVFMPSSSGDWLIGLTGIDHALLFLDGELLIDYSKDLQPGKLFFEFCQAEKTAIVTGMKRGQSYTIEVRCWNSGKLDALPVRLPAGFQIGAVPVLDPDQGIAEAVELSASCDATVVVIGLGKDYETEGSDRSTME